MAKYNYLNLGCGKRYHPDWTNLDMVSFDSNVQEANFIKGIPFNDNSFDVVYHSHVLEHFTKDDGVKFIKECFRVLKKGGTIRIALPNLEKSIRLYLQFLEENMTNPTPESEANYDWMMIELYDQCVRTESGGGMKKYLLQDQMVNKDFVSSRIGIIAQDYFKKKETVTKTTLKKKLGKFWSLNLKNKLYLLHDFFFQKILFGRLGRFFNSGQQRLSGELHFWMYDRYSLSRLLKNIGFSEIKVQTATSSYIKDWSSFNLDSLEDGYVLKPDSLYIEAKK